MRVEKQPRFVFFILFFSSIRPSRCGDATGVTISELWDHAALQPWPAPTASHNRKTVGTAEVREILPKVWQEGPVVWCATLWHTHRAAFHSFAPAAFPPLPKCSNVACQHPSLSTGISCDDSYGTIYHLHSYVLHWLVGFIKQLLFLSRMIHVSLWFYVMLISNKVSHKGYKANRNIFIECF